MKKAILYPPHNNMGWTLQIVNPDPGIKEKVIKSFKYKDVLSAEPTLVENKNLLIVEFVSTDELLLQYACRWITCVCGIELQT